MINIVIQKKFPRRDFIILLSLAFFLAACPTTKIEKAEKSPVISSDQNVEAIDESDEEYDSSAAYSQDSDN